VIYCRNTKIRVYTKYGCWFEFFLWLTNYGKEYVDAWALRHFWWLSHYYCCYWKQFVEHKKAHKNMSRNTLGDWLTADVHRVSSIHSDGHLYTSIVASVWIVQWLCHSLLRWPVINILWCRRVTVCIVLTVISTVSYLDKRGQRWLWPSVPMGECEFSLWTEELWISSTHDICRVCCFARVMSNFRKVNSLQSCVCFFHCSGMFTFSFFCYFISVSVRN